MSEESLTDTDGFFSRSSKGPLEVYNMKNVRRGLALIFNYEEFDPDLKMNPRFGSETDCKNLKRSLKGLGFEVNVFTNLRQEVLKETISKTAKDDHSNADCLLVVFMSHGHGGHVYTYDGELAIKDITDKFRGTKCKSLAGKPKIFIFQACRGSEHDQPVDSANTEVNIIEAGSINTFPAGSDFIMCYSVAKGFFSFRSTVNGSWYIQDLCKLLEKYGDSLEFTQLLTLVNRDVATRDGRMRINHDYVKTKQMPCFASMLTKNLYFHPKK
ncbi:caspase-6-like [Betta splendens]|uniref:Caspase-6 n=1 Tax=Betta splendens TaxID=158456 RepID=A0A6P7NLB7_BETSP|nr:caspase-6-like [Betta splendens]